MEQQIAVVGAKISNSILSLPCDDEEPVAIPHFAPGALPLLRLTRVHDMQRLEHVLTGEVHELQPLDDGNQWALVTTGPYGYMCAPSQKPVWCNELLRTTVWRSKGELYFETVPLDDSEDTMVVWMSDSINECTVQFPLWPATFEVPVMPRLTLRTMHSPRDGSRLFFDISDVQDAAQFEAKYVKSAQWPTKKPSTVEFLNRLLWLSRNSSLSPHYRA